MMMSDIIISVDNERFLATLRMPSDDDAENATQTQTSSSSSSPTTPSIALSMHHAPRFGHSNHLGLILAPNPMEYASGIKQFSLAYLIVPLILWTCLLLSFKFCYTKSRVGCAAGGSILNLKEMKHSQQLSRKQRQRRILRSWRLQSTFLMASLMIPLISIVMMTVGLNTLTSSIVEMQEFVGDVDTLAYRGWSALEGLQQTQQELFVNDNSTTSLKSNNELVQGILDFYGEATSVKEAEEQEQQQIDTFMQQHHNGEFRNISSIDNNGKTPLYTSSSSQSASSSPSTTQQQQQHASFVETWCPNAANASTSDLDIFMDAMDTIQDHTKDMVELLESFGGSSIATISNAFQTVTSTTQTVDLTLEWFLQNDWILKLLILVLNVVTFLLFLNVFLLSKNNIIHAPTRFYTSWILVPLFVALIMAIVVITLLLGICAIINSDFCRGGVDGGSVQGTLEDGLLAYYHQGDLRERLNVSGVTVTSLQQAQSMSPLFMATASIDYYASGCLSNNPLEFVDVVTGQLDVASAHVNQLATILVPSNGDNGDTINTTALLNQACGKDMSFLFPALDDLNSKIGSLSKNLHKLTEDVVGCHQIAPLYKRLTHGAMCHESPYGLTILWICSLLLCILGFVMLTTRAALYNSVKRRKPRERKPRRVVEKEFNDYKDFMKDYYDDTEAWMLDEPLPSEYGVVVVDGKATKIALDFKDGLESKSTFETVASSNLSSDEGAEDTNDLEDVDLRSSRPTRKKCASPLHGIHNLKNSSFNASHHWEDGEDVSYGSEYESEDSDDSDYEDDDRSSVGDDESAILSFFSETRSMAMQSIHSLQRLKPLLARVVPPGLLPSPKEEKSNDEDDDFLFQDKDIGEDRKPQPPPDPSVTDDSLYLGSSLCEPPTTPGLQPVSLLVNGNGKDEEYDDSLAYPNPYKSKKSPKRPHNDPNAKTATWFGQSARHRNNTVSKKSNKKNNGQENDVPGLLELLTPSSVMSALTPLAPKKPFSFFTRAKKEETDGLLGDHGHDNELVFEDQDESCLGTPRVRHRRISRGDTSPSAMSPGLIRPTKLEMSPLLGSNTKKNTKRKNASGAGSSRTGRHLDFRKESQDSRHDQGKAATDSASTPSQHQKQLPVRSTPSRTTSFSAPYVQELVRRYDKSSNGNRKPSANKPKTVVASNVRRKTASSWSNNKKI